MTRIAVLGCGAALVLAGCGFIGQQAREAQLREMAQELSGLGPPVIGARVKELGSGAKYANVSVQVAEGTEQIAPDSLRDMLEIVAAGTPERYPSVDFRVGTPDHNPVDLTEPARALDVYPYAVTGAGTLAFNRVDLVELVSTW